MQQELRPPRDLVENRYFFSDEIHSRYWPPVWAMSRFRRPILVIITLLLMWADYATGPNIRIPALYVIPILLFAWYDGPAWGIAAGWIIVSARFGMDFIWRSVPWTRSQSITTALIAGAGIAAIVYYISQVGRLSREVRVLRGLLPICMHCKRIRDSHGRWNRLEYYITEYSEAQFTHGICDTCLQGEKNKITES